MLIPIEILKKYVDIDNTEEFLKNFSLRSAEVDSVKKFCSVEGLKIGKILKIENHPDSNHLHITTVDTGDVIEDIVCGAPNVEVGKKVIVAKVGVSLPDTDNPGKTITMKKALIRGVESNGMNCSLDELGIDHKFQGYDGIYYLDDDAPIGEDPIKYLHLDDTVLEIELTPNKQDLLSIIGVAYDTKAMLNSKMHLEFDKAKRISEECSIKVESETKDCLRYFSREIKDVVIKESPAWLKGALMKMNIRPINNVVDITNYCLMVTGQPLHAFDKDKIETKKIVVRNAKENETIVTLDEKERVLNNSDIVITDGIKPLCLAGVMGGLESEVTEKTTSIFLESALFNPECIKQTSKRLGLSSESSLRFEKGINPEMTEYSIELACKMFEELAGGKVLSLGSNYDTVDTSENMVSVTLEKINSVVGRTYTKEEVERVFKSLSFRYEIDGTKFNVYIPKRRADIYGYQDLIEEVSRIIGFESIESTIPASKAQGKLTPYQAFVRRIRHILSLNLNETLTYSLTTEAKATYFDNTEYELVKIMNPLVDDRVCMRHSLIPSLLEVLKYNLNRKNNDNFYFEIGRRYEMSKETPLLSIVLSGRINDLSWRGEETKVDFFYLKGLVEDLFDKLSIKNYKIELPEDELKGMHPYQSAVITLAREKIGFIGKLSPSAEKDFEVKDVYVFEVELDKLFNGSHELKSVKAINKYPSIERDLALVMDNNITSEYLINEIKRSAKKCLESVSVFDLYRISDSLKQLAVKLVFSDNTRTLGSSEVDTYISDVLSHLEKLNIKLRQ